jgi:hypothetical protein
VKIKILPQAEQDLIDGFHFYEMQQTGLGGYFLDTLFSDIESLEFFAGMDSRTSEIVFQGLELFGVRWQVYATPLSADRAASRLRVAVPFGHSSLRMAVYASLRLRPHSKIPPAEKPLLI